MDRSLFDSIEEIENLWITMSDGCRLAARVWLPKDARTAPVPAVLEYIPYRKRDFMRARDEPIHRYFALKGHASVRVDLRGSGDSDGVLHDEYSQQEHEDALEVIAWIAAQDWCSGAVGMMGISWGGFNALQVAALRPPALKAIITLCSTDDRYADDAHYMGGCLLNENMQWGSALTLYSALPPDPDLVGDRWREMWQERLAALEPFPALWMKHPWRDDYWKHGSVCEDYDAIEIPVYAIGGWADGYSNAIPRLLQNLAGPRKGLIGPWAHNFPHDALPGPSVGFLQEAVRWWDQWLLGRETGIMDEPMVRAWMQEPVPPQAQYEVWPGRWVAEDEWPSPRIRPLRYFLNPGHLWFDSDPPTELSFTSPQTTGVRAGEWCAFGVDGEMPTDQRPDDGGSLVFDSDPIEKSFEILGAPVVELDVRADQPVAMLAVRLCDIAPDGSSLRVSYGLLNLCHRDSYEFPTALEPQAWYRVTVKLNDIAHRFPAGHRLRVAVSTSYWPIAWPSPKPVALTIRTGTSTLDLPVRPPHEADARLPAFDEPEAAPSDAPRHLRRRSGSRRIESDLISSEMVYTLKSGGGEPDGVALSRIEAIDLDIGYRSLRRYRILESDPLSAQTELASTATLKRGPWHVRIECRTRLATTEDAFQFSCDLECHEGDRVAFERHWTVALPRRLL